MLATTKCCAVCQTAKPVDHFYRRQRSPDGRQRPCIACARPVLDAATAERRHPKPCVVGGEGLERLLRARAADEAGALWDAAEDGAPFPMEFLVDVLGSERCPTIADD